MRIPVAVTAVALMYGSCATHPRLKPGQPYEWNPKSSVTVGIAVKELTDAFRVDLSIISRLMPAIGDLEDGTPNIVAQVTSDDGAVEKGIPRRTHPEYGGAGVFRAGISVSFSKSNSKGKPRLLTLRVQGEGETFEILMP